MSMIKYTKLNEKIERISKWFISAFMSFHVMGFLAGILLTLTNYFMYDLGDESFQVIYLAVWPFNRNTPFGYFIEIAVEFAADMCGQIWTLTTECYFIGLGQLTNAFAKDIVNDLNLLIVGGTSNQNQTKLIERFCRIVDFYSDAR